MRGVIRILLVLVLAMSTFPARAEEKEAPQIDFRKELAFRFEPNPEPWKPKSHEANAEEGAPQEKKKLTKRDKMGLALIITVVVTGIALSIYSERENAKGGDGSICCRSLPYVENQPPPTTQEPGGGDGGGSP